MRRLSTFTGKKGLDPLKDYYLDIIYGNLETDNLGSFWTF